LFHARGVLEYGSVADPITRGGVGVLGSLNRFDYAALRGVKSMKNSWLVLILVLVAGYLLGIYYPATGRDLIGKVTG
jgi:hypothetical protein